MIGLFSREVWLELNAAIGFEPHRRAISGATREFPLIYKSIWSIMVDMTITAKSSSGRHVRGASLIGAVKTLRKIRKETPLPPLSPEAQEILETQIIVSQWYLLEPFEEFMEIIYTILFKCSEKTALEMSIDGGMSLFQEPHKGLITKGDPKSSLLALRHTWKVHFDFGELATTAESDHSVSLTLTGYPDIAPVHAMTNTGYAVAVARIAGAQNVSGEVLEKPWRGAPHLRYRVRF